MFVIRALGCTASALLAATRVWAILSARHVLPATLLQSIRLSAFFHRVTGPVTLAMDRRAQTALHARLREDLKDRNVWTRVRPENETMLKYANFATRALRCRTATSV